MDIPNSSWLALSVTMCLWALRPFSVGSVTFSSYVSFLLLSRAVSVGLLLAVFKPAEPVSFVFVELALN